MASQDGPRRLSWLRSTSFISKSVPSPQERRKSILGVIKRLSNVRLTGRCSGKLVRQNCTFEALPEDVMLEILAFLDAQCVLRTAKVSRRLRDLTNTHAVWRAQATHLMNIGRPLVLPGFSTLYDLSSHEMKLAVLRTIRLADKWSARSISEPNPRRPLSFAYERKKGDGVRPLRSLDSEKVTLAFSVPQCLCYIVKFKHFLLPPTRDGQLVGWDIEARQDLGVYDMARGILHDAEQTTGINRTANRTARGLIFSGRVHFPSRSLYYIVSGGFVSGQEMQFYILRIQFPSGSETKAGGRIQYTRIAGFTLPYAFIIEMHILDVARRMLCMVLLCPSTGMLYLYVVFDWDTKESAIMNTGLEYKFRKTVISLRLSVDGENIILRSEKDGFEVQRLYSVVALRQLSPTFNQRKSPSPPVFSTLTTSQPITPPIRETQILWSDGVSRSLSSPFPNPGLPGLDALIVAETFAYRVWNMLPWWPTFNDVPYRTSTVVLYWTDYPAPGEPRWTIAQHFATDSGPCPIVDLISPSAPSQFSSASTLAPYPASVFTPPNAGVPFQADAINKAEAQAVYKRCIVPMRDPVIVPFSDDRVPILGLAYNYVGWIEQVESRRRGRRSKKRVAMLASFPEPGAGSVDPSCLAPGFGGNEKREGLKANVQILDVPERVLDAACHLIVDSSSATVSITTQNNELYTYRYA